VNVKLCNDVILIWPTNYLKVLNVGNESSFREYNHICKRTRRRYVAYCVLFVFVFALYTLCLCLEVFCMFVKQWRLKGSFDNYCVCFIIFHLLSSELLMFHYLSLFIFCHFFMFYCMLPLIKPIVLLAFSSHLIF
jgi:uncharacterized membrane protein YhaH (DUF805 family)